jgi:hypothetical protein
MTDLTPAVHTLLREQHNVRSEASREKRVNEFLKEAHRIVRPNP